LPENKKTKHHLWPRARANRDAELDEALRELGEEVLKQDIPERLLSVLRSARQVDETREPAKKGKPDGA
jgi:hypothetical protein